jgi:hypothetical protein
MTVHRRRCCIHLTCKRGKLAAWWYFLVDGTPAFISIGEEKPKRSASPCCQACAEVIEARANGRAA